MSLPILTSAIATTLVIRRRCTSAKVLRDVRILIVRLRVFVGMLNLAEPIERLLIRRASRPAQWRGVRHETRTGITPLRAIFTRRPEITNRPPSARGVCAIADGLQLFGRSPPDTGPP